MSSRKFATMDPEERKQVIDGIYDKLAPQIEAAVNRFLKEIEPRVRTMTRDEVGKWAVTDKQATAFLDGMVIEAAQKIMKTFRPRWFSWFFFRR